MELEIRMICERETELDGCKPNVNMLNIKALFCALSLFTFQIDQEDHLVNTSK